jgi:predicted glutamine amidotransferase
LRRPLEGMLDDPLFAARQGTTDSELLFLLALQFGLEKNPLGAMFEAIDYVERLAARLHCEVLVRSTSAFSDGKTLYAVRYATDSKAPTLYAAPLGAGPGYCLVSEPLNDDVNAWIEIPSGSAIVLSDRGVEASPFGATPTYAGLAMAM